MEPVEGRETEENKVLLQINYKIVMQSRFNSIFVLLFVSVNKFDLYTEYLNFFAGFFIGNLYGDTNFFK